MTTQGSGRDEDKNFHSNLPSVLERAGRAELRISRTIQLAITCFLKEKHQRENKLNFHRVKELKILPWLPNFVGINHLVVKINGISLS